MSDPLSDFVTRYPMWGALIIVAGFIAGWYVGGWLKRRR